MDVSKRGAWSKQVHHEQCDAIRRPCHPTLTMHNLLVGVSSTVSLTGKRSMPTFIPQHDGGVDEVLYMLFTPQGMDSPSCPQKLPPAACPCMK